MLKTLGSLAAELGAELVGNPDIEIRRVVHPAHAENEHDLALVYSPAVARQFREGQVRTALVPREPAVPGIPNQLKVARPRVIVARLLEIFERPPVVADGVHPSAAIDPTAELAAGVRIGPLCSVGPGTKLGPRTTLAAGVHIGANVRIGSDCFFFGGVCVGDRVQIGDRVLIKANAAIGNDGFSFQTVEPGTAELARQSGKGAAAAAAGRDSEILRINSVGTVVIEDDVEIGSCTCVDRGTLHETRIGAGTKIDNLVQIAHNVQIGRRCIIVAMAGLAGSVTIGERVVIAAQAGIPDHVKIGDESVVMPQSGVPGDLPPRSFVGGSPAMPKKDYLNTLMQIKRIKGLAKRLRELEDKLGI